MGFIAGVLTNNEQNIAGADGVVNIKKHKCDIFTRESVNPSFPIAAPPGSVVRV
jgi:hypothetical protein